jgi:hypothetical protein
MQILQKLRQALFLPSFLVFAGGRPRALQGLGTYENSRSPSFESISDAAPAYATE